MGHSCGMGETKSECAAGDVSCVVLGRAIGRVNKSLQLKETFDKMF